MKELIMKLLNEKKQELEELKEMHKSMWETYGSELSAGDMHSKEKALKDEIKELEEKDETMYLLYDGSSYAKAGNVGVYVSDVGKSIFFKKPSMTFDNEVISSDDKQFWDILSEEATKLSKSIDHHEWRLREDKASLELIEKAYGRRE